MDNNKPVLLYLGNKLLKHGSNPTGVEFLGRLLEEDGFTVIYAGSRKNKVARIFQMIFMIIAERRQYQLVLIDTYSGAAYYYAFICSQLCRILNKQYILILRGGDLLSRIEQTPLSAKVLFGKSAGLVSPSLYLKDKMESLGIAISFIPNPIQLKKYEFSHREIQTPHLLWVRAFHKIYNPGLAVKAFSEIVNTYPDAKLTMIGPDKDGSLQITKNLAQALGIRDKIEFTGKLSKADWISKAEDCNMFLNTTHYDNIPISVLEAMALGLPVISTNVGGIPYLIEHDVNGLLVDDDDSDGIVQAINNLVKDEETSKRLAINAYGKLKVYDSEEVIKRWDEYLTSFTRNE